MTEVANEEMLRQCKKWVEIVVIGLNFCPFAKAPAMNGQIKYVVDDCIEHDGVLALAGLKEEISYLQENSKIETTLLILPQLKDFYQYLDYLDLCNDYLEANEFEGIFQLASFHPDYVFEGSSADDPANYTNRSPFPVIHIIREESIDRAVKSYKKTELIPENNIKLCQEKGVEFMKGLLDSIKH